MASAVKIHTELNPLQVSRFAYSTGLCQTRTLELKTLLVNHYSAMLKKEVGKAVKDKKYTQEDFDDMLN